MARKLTNRSSVSRGTMPAARPNGYAAVNAAGHSEGYRPNVHAKASAQMKLNIASATARVKASKSAGNATAKSPVKSYAKATSPTKTSSMVSTTAKMKKRSGR